MATTTAPVTAARPAGRRRRLRALLVAGLFLGCAGTTPVSAGATISAVPRATCSPGDRPETGLQGQVRLADRTSGRSKLGYTCNLTLVGRLQAQGGSWIGASYGRCYYMPTTMGSLSLQNRGVQVVDVRDPRHPTISARLQTPAMLGPWESLKVSPRAGLLAAVLGGAGIGAGPVYFDLYDVRTDCAHPRLLASLPLQLPFGHEGAFSADGRTYYSSATWTPVITAIDVSAPTRPRIITFLPQLSHGLSTSTDGTKLYVAQPKPADGFANGLAILDVASVQHRTGQVATSLSTLSWNDGSLAQQTIPVSYGRRQFVITTDEGGSGGGALNTRGPAGAVRLIDVSDPRRPVITSHIRLQIGLPQNQPQAQADTDSDGAFGYQAHYCQPDRASNPTALACGFFQSGIRLFDIRNPRSPYEIGYFNPPAQTGQEARLPGSEHAGGGEPTHGVALSGDADLTADWCTSAPRWVPTSSGWQLWTHCQDNGFLALAINRRIYPRRN